MIAIKNLSFWARNNKWKSWLIIAFCHFLLAYLAIFLANIAFFSGLSLHLYWLFALVGMITVIFGFYPLKNRRRANLALITSGFVLIFSLFNVMITEYEQKPTQVNSLAVQTILKSSISDFENESTLTKFRKKIKRKSYQRTQQFKTFWQTQNRFTKALLIFATILSSVFLAFILLFLASSATLSGASAGAGIILILGWSATIIAGFFMIKAIFKNSRIKINKLKENTNKAI